VVGVVVGEAAPMVGWSAVQLPKPTSSSAAAVKAKRGRKAFSP
jgi:hypothetical protein